MNDSIYKVFVYFAFNRQLLSQDHLVLPPQSFRLLKQPVEGTCEARITAAIELGKVVRVKQVLLPVRHDFLLVRAEDRRHSVVLILVLSLLLLILLLVRELRKHGCLN